MKHFFTLLGDLLFYAFTHALSENCLDALNWTTKPSTRLATAAVGHVTLQTSIVMVWNANSTFGPKVGICLMVQCRAADPRTPTLSLDHQRAQVWKPEPMPFDDLSEDDDRSLTDSRYIDNRMCRLPNVGDRPPNSRGCHRWRWCEGSWWGLHPHRQPNASVNLRVTLPNWSSSTS